LLAVPVVAAVAQPLEQAVKAAFLPKFARYVIWPERSRRAVGERFQLCIIGNDGFGPLIDEAASGEQIDQHSIIVRRMASVEQADGCRIAFVQGKSPKDNSSILASLRSRPVLTVTDQKLGPDRGMIHFVVHQGRVRFHIDAAAAAQTGLSIDSRLLGLALTVKQRRS
jgi:hypothetical protein